MMSDFEEDYLDVLQNIEFAVVSVYHEQPGLMDSDVEKALNTLLLEYQAQRQNRAAQQPRLNAPAQQVYERVKKMCEWRLGRGALEAEGEEVSIPESAALSVDEVLACLKRIRKSVQKWNKRNGERGYLQFINQYIV